MLLIKNYFRELRSLYRKRKIISYVKRQKQIRLIIGAAGTKQSGWLSCDQKFLDLIDENTWKSIFFENSIHSIFAEHVWEHLNEQDGVYAASICYKYLKKGGVLRLAVPDGFHPNVSYIDEVKPNGTGPGADDHKVLYNYISLRSILNSTGFNVELKEYFDEHGSFVEHLWDDRYGMVKRSKYNDSRNLNGSLKYTSIIVDAVK